MVPHSTQAAQRSWFRNQLIRLITALGLILMLLPQVGAFHASTVAAAPPRAHLADADSNIVVTPMSYDFGTITAPTDTLDATITISNTGTGFLNFSSIDLTGTDKDSFKFTRGSCFIFFTDEGSDPQIGGIVSVFPGESCTIDVHFIANTTGVKNADITINSDDTTNPTVQVALTGNVQKALLPEITVSPSSYDFGTREAPEDLANATITISNTGGADLHLNSIGVSGTDASTFSIIGGSCFNGIVYIGSPPPPPINHLAPGASCNVILLYRATTAGAKSASLDIVSDASNNASVSVPLTATAVDNVAPAAPEILSPTNGTVTSDSMPTIGGTGPTSTNITVRDSTGNVICALSYPVPYYGFWYCTPTTPLAPGTYTIIATATDPDGKTSVDSAAVTFTIVDASSQLNPPTIDQPTAGTLITETMPLISGTAPAGAAVSVYEQTTNAVICTTTADAATSAWSCTPSTPLVAGTHAINVTSTDFQGNTLSGTGTIFVVDVVAAPDIISPAADSTTSDPTPVISGTSELGTIVMVREGDTTICVVSADATTGDWDCVPDAPFSNGTHTISATATNVNTTTSTAATQTFVVDIPVVEPVAPNPPVITSPAAGSVMSNATPTISGTADAGATVTVSEDGTTICTAMADATTGAWSCTPSAPFREGAHTISATATNTNGATSTPTTQAFVVRTPVANVPAPNPPVITSPAPGSVTSNARPTISGTADAGVTVVVELDTNNDGTPDVTYTTTADEHGNWSVNTATATPSSGTFPASGLAVGTRLGVTALAKNAAGVTSTATTAQVRIMMQIYLPTVIASR